MLAVGVLSLGALNAYAQSTPQARRGSAENALVGIGLYDTGAKVVTRFGSPTEIQALNAGGGGAGGAGGGGLSAPGRSGGGGGGGGVADAVVDSNRELIGDPFGLGPSPWRQAAPSRVPEGSGISSGPGAGPGGSGRESAGGGGAGNAGQSQKIIYTRWVYKRKDAKYSFVFDKFNRVVQIEAIGLRNSSVRTRRGLTFGSSFATIIKNYNAPDGYEIAGDNIIVRFLVRDNVAFRLSKIDPNKPHVVTGIVVAAGKT